VTKVLYVPYLPEYKVRVFFLLLLNRHLKHAGRVLLRNFPDCKEGPSYIRSRLYYDNLSTI